MPEYVESESAVFLMMENSCHTLGKSYLGLAKDFAKLIETRRPETAVQAEMYRRLNQSWYVENHGPYYQAAGEDELAFMKWINTLQYERRK